MWRASSEARKRARAGISSASSSAGLRAAQAPARAAPAGPRRSRGIDSPMLVRVAPGQIALQRTPWGAYIQAVFRVSPTRACLDAV